MTAPAEPIEPRSLFISYRRRDSSASSLWLAESLRLAFGRESVFIDSDSIRIGEDWPAHIEAALQRASLLLVVIGPSWLRVQDDYGRRRLDNSDDWVRTEIRHALTANLNILPVLLDDAEIPRPEGLPSDIAKLTHRKVFRIRIDEWARDREELLQQIERLGFRRAREVIEYPRPFVQPNELSSRELQDSLHRLGAGWQLVTRSNSQAPGGEARELHRQFVFESFEDAIHFMTSAARRISRTEHHPDWRNTWKTVSVWLTTWDIGHKPSALDLELAEYLERLYADYHPGAK